MAVIKISEAQAKRFLDARLLDNYKRKQVKKQLFAEIRRQHGIPSYTKFRIAVENPDNPNYLVVRDKRSDQPLTNGAPEPVVSTVASTPAPAPADVAPVAKAIAKVADKKAAAPKAPAAKKAPAKKAAPVKAPAAKKAPAKKAAPVKAPAAVAFDKPKEVRITVDGKRIRLGSAKTQAEFDKLLKAGKKRYGVK